jgi:hypothetical protein
VVASSSGSPIRLVENPAARDPTWAQLVAFVATDQTDTHAYVEEEPGGYMCAEFARDVHNNAEKAGIRAGFVALSFAGESVGHALDAFETTDRGLVYIDCTGGRMYADMPDAVITRNCMFLQTQTHDTVAYIEVGQPYGRIPIYLAASTDYAFYAQHVEEWNTYVALLEAYDRDLAAFDAEYDHKRVQAGSADWKAWQAGQKLLDAANARLEAMESELGAYPFESLGVVEKVYIKW